MKFLTWQNPEQLIVAQEFIKIFKILSCGIKDELKQALADVKESREEGKADHKAFNAFLDDLDVLKDPDNPIHGSKEADYNFAFQKIDNFYDKVGFEHGAFYYYFRAGVYNSMLAYFSRNIDRGKSFDPNMLNTKLTAAKDDAQRAVNLENDAKFVGCPVRCSEKQRLKSPVELLI